MLEQGSASFGLWAKSWQLSDFVVLLKHSHTLLFPYCLWLLLCYLTELSRGGRDRRYVALRAKNIYCLAL